MNKFALLETIFLINTSALPRTTFNFLLVTQFLTHLAVTEHVAATTQNQALNVIVFLYRVVLQQELVGIDAVRAKKSRYLPTVLTPDEVQQVIHHLYCVYKLVVQLRAWIQTKFSSARLKLIYIWIALSQLRRGFYRFIQRYKLTEFGSLNLPDSVTYWRYSDLYWMNQVEQWFSILQRKRLRIADFNDCRMPL